MFEYRFVNSQGCVLMCVVANSSRSAWAKFRKVWQTAGVSIELIGKA